MFGKYHKKYHSTKVIHNIKTVLKKNLLVSEAFRHLNSHIQLLRELFIALVRWQVEPIKAGVWTWQPIVLSNPLNAEQLRTGAAHQFSKTTNGYTASSCDKLEQTCPLFLVKTSDPLPEPNHLKMILCKRKKIKINYLLALRSIMSIYGISLPVININVLHSTK